MTSANHYPEGALPEPVPSQGEGMLEGVHYRAQQRWASQAAEVASQQRHEAQRQRMLQAFYGFTQQELGINAKSPRRVDEPTLAHAVHDFAHKAVVRRNTISEVDIRLIDQQRVAKLIDQHYAKFRLSRDATTGRKHDAELEAINKMRRKVYLTEYSETPFGTESDTGFTGTPRSQGYPEIGITLELRHALLEDDSQLAMEASEVVLAAYGSSFPPVTSYRTIEVQDETGTVMRKIEPAWPQEQGSPLIQRISEDTIPFDARAEYWRPR